MWWTKLYPWRIWKILNFIKSLPNLDSRLPPISEWVLKFWGKNDLQSIMFSLHDKNWKYHGYYVFLALVCQSTNPKVCIRLALYCLSQRHESSCFVNDNGFCRILAVNYPKSLFFITKRYMYSCCWKLQIYPS